MKASQDRVRTQATYDSLSRYYDLLSGSAEDQARQQAADLLDIQLGDILLEVGCGTGTAAIEMGRKVGPGGFVYGVDLSIKMLRTAQKKLQQKGVRASVGFLSGDAVNLPLSSQSVTGFLMSFTLELFPDEEITLVLSECRRVLCQGGRLCVLSMSKCQPQARLLKPYMWLHDHFPAWIDCRPILLQQTLIRHGFEIIKARQDSLFGLPIEIVLAITKNESR
jgi:ubiquinone/menaquinone biosynthesis C-methylase UbiE